MAWFHHGLQDTIQTRAFTATESGAATVAGESPVHLPLPSVPAHAPGDLPSCPAPAPGASPSCPTSALPLSFITLQEQRCVLSWFLGWTPPQRQRFLQDLVSKAVPGKVSSLLEQLNTLQVKDRPPNIFECQLRLWTQWFESWSEDERNAFLSLLEESDASFVAHFYTCLAGTAGQD